jgi:hypothetical protein
MCSCLEPSGDRCRAAHPELAEACEQHLGEYGAKAIEMALQARTPQQYFVTTINRVLSRHGRRTQYGASVARRHRRLVPAGGHRR